MNAWYRVGTLAVLGALTTGGCSGESSNSAGSLAGTGDFGGSSPSNGGSNTGGVSGGGAGESPAVVDAAAALPPETKTEADYQSPVATGKIVWTANPTSGRVAYVDATTFVVQTVQAGDGPTYLAAVPNADPASTSEAAIVLNVRSQDATLLRSDGTGGPPSTTTFPSTADANAWAMSPSGRWAIAWTDATRIANADPTQGFQDLAVLDLSPTSPRPPSILGDIGYRPSQVVFSADETEAFVVTEDGISVIDLVGGQQPAVTQNFPLSAPTPVTSLPDAAAADAGAPDVEAPDALLGEASASEAGAGQPASEAGGGMSPPQSSTSGMPDVSFTPDGSFALIRQDGVAAITVVSLNDGSPTTVALPEAPSDLTVSPDGTFAIAVLRELGAVAILPLPGIVSAPTSLTLTPIPGEVVGRAIVAQNGTLNQTSVLLFTTAAPIERLTVLTLKPQPSIRTIVLHAPVLAVFPTGDAQNAIVLHSVTPTPGSSVKGAFSIVPIAQDLPAKIVSLGAPPIAVALAPPCLGACAATNSDSALVMVSDQTSVFAVELVTLPSLDVREYTLPSPPTAVGIATAAGDAGSGFVAQNYADGRITFIDLGGGTVRTITGFELSARVVQGSDQ
ncbi:MAG: hypothetical protein WBY94_12920 [Polyangiaceae bacterium]